MEVSTTAENGNSGPPDHAAPRISAGQLAVVPHTVSSLACRLFAGHPPCSGELFEESPLLPAAGKWDPMGQDREPGIPKCSKAASCTVALIKMM